MSLASIKVKEVTGKKNILPKLKTILANPIQRKPFLLNDLELQSFGQLLKDSIAESDSEAQKFVIDKNICIGLESVLRAINKSQVSIVFLSQGMKPQYVVNLISRNTEIKNPGTQIYIVPQLEQFTKEIFGIPSLVFSLPTTIENVGIGLAEWLSQRKTIFSEKHKPRVNLKQTVEKRRRKEMFIKGLKKSETNCNDNPTSTWSRDYLSFSKSSKALTVNAINLDEDTSNLLNVLKKVTNNVQTNKNINDNNKEYTGIIQDLKEGNGNKEFITGALDIDDFLPNYQPLQVHKICPNPNKKKKDNK